MSCSRDSEQPSLDNLVIEGRFYDGGGRYISILGRNGLFHHPADVRPDAVGLEVTTKWVNVFVQLGVQLAA